MTKVILALISIATTGSLALGADAVKSAVVKDQTITCYRDNTESARALAKYWQLHPASQDGDGRAHKMMMEDISDLQIVIKDGKLVDAKMKNAFGAEAWTLASESDDKAFGYSEPTQAKNGTISLTLSYDYYDHYNYKLSLNPNKLSGKITASGEIEGGDGIINSMAVYSCNNH